MALSRSSVRRSLGVGIFLLTLATAFIHLFLGFSAIPYYGLNFGVVLFILNGLGYLGLLGVLQLPSPQLRSFRSAARWTLVGFAALTIVLWVILAPVYNFIGYLDKAIEVALIVLLVADAYKASLGTIWRDSQYDAPNGVVVMIEASESGDSRKPVFPTLEILVNSDYLVTIRR